MDLKIHKMKMVKSYINLILFNLDDAVISTSNQASLNHNLSDDIPLITQLASNIPFIGRYCSETGVIC